MAKITNALQKCLISTISAYQYILSPLLGNRCRFYPSCSHYTQEAICHYGVMKGGWSALCRIARCHPWHPGGYDPVIKESKKQIVKFTRR